jgi:hypothetical protein
MNGSREILSNPTQISCHHGSRPAAVVCCHMLTVKDSVVGFVENSSDPNDLQAWCEACEAMFIGEGDRTERFLAFNDRQIVCDVCYGDLKSRHSRPGAGTS